MIALLILALLVVLVAFPILDWAADSRDDIHKLWPLDGTEAEVDGHAAGVASPSFR